MLQLILTQTLSNGSQKNNIVQIQLKTLNDRNLVVIEISILQELISRLIAYAQSSSRNRKISNEGN